MFPKNLFMAGLLGLLSLNAVSQEISENNFGNGLVNFVAKDSSYSLNFAARFQSLYTTNWNVGGDEFAHDGSNFLIRRARLKFDGFAYSPKLKYKLELGLSNRDISGSSVYTSNASRIILDAVLKWNFHGNFTLWGGQAKLPGNRERVISSANLQFVDRSLLNSRYNIDRDMGVQLHHGFTIGEQFQVKEALAITQGEGRNVTGGNLGGLQYTGRIEVLPFGSFLGKGDYMGGDLQRHPSPKLSVGASYSFNDNAVKNRSTMGSYLVTDAGFHETDIQVFFLDAMFKYRGFSFMGEYASRSADEPLARNAGGSLTGAFVPVGNGLNLQAGYMLPRDFELAGRYTAINFDNDLDEDQYTLALSKYVVGHKLKVQTDLSYTTVEGLPEDDLLYRLQFELHF